MISPFSIVNAAGAARRIDVFGGIDLRIPSAATAGDMSVWEANAEPGEGPPLHIHTREDELFYVLEGTFRFWCGGETFVGGPGTTAILPRNVPHTFRNVGTTRGRIFAAAMPGGFENFFLEVERANSMQPEVLDEIAARHGLRFLPPEAANDDRPGEELSTEELLVTSG